MSTNDEIEKKRVQNKLSQRKHRAKQQSKIKELEGQVSLLTERLNRTIYNKSKDELKTIYKQSMSRVDRIYKEVSELKDFMRYELFSSLNEQEVPPQLQTQGNGSIARRQSIIDADINEDDSGTITDDSAQPSPIAVIEEPEQETLTNGLSQAATTITDVNEILKCYLHFSTMSTLSIIDAHLYSVEDVINNIGTQFITTINKIKAPIELSSNLQILNSPDILNMVCAYANEIFEKVPKLNNYTFALGGVKWLCGQILLFCLTNPNFESLINNVLFNPYNDNSKTLSSNLQQNLKVWLNATQFNKAIDLVSNLKRESSASNTLAADMMNYDPILHQFFLPTTLQTYLMKHNTTKYPHWINFIIWPEFRDALLTKWDKISAEDRNLLLNGLLDNVVLVVKDDEGITDDKVFFMSELSTVVNYTLDCLNQGLSAENEILINPSIFKLQNNGLFNPKFWKVTKSYGARFKDIVPKSLVVWQIDDLNPQNVIKPVYPVML